MAGIQRNSAWLDAKSEAGTSDPSGLFLGVSFLVLLLTVLVALYQLRVIGGRKATDGRSVTATSVVLLIGTAGTWMVAISESRRTFDINTGGGPSGSQTFDRRPGAATPSEAVVRKPLASRRAPQARTRVGGLGRS